MAIFSPTFATAHLASGSLVLTRVVVDARDHRIVALGDLGRDGAPDDEGHAGALEDRDRGQRDAAVPVAGRGQHLRDRWWRLQGRGDAGLRIGGVVEDDGLGSSKGRPALFA